MRGRKLKLIGRILLALILTFLVIQIPFYIINNPAFQQWFLKAYKPFHPWVVSLDKVTLQPWHLRLTIDNLKMNHPAGHEISITSILAKARLRTLFSKGKIELFPFEVKNLNILVAKSPISEKGEKKKRFKLRTLLFLQNIILKEGHIENLTLNLPKDKILLIDDIHLVLEPAFFSGARFALKLDHTLFQSGSGKKQTIRRLQLDVSTNLEEWSKTFPYMDNINGKLNVGEATFGNLDIRELKADLGFKNNRIASEQFSINIGGNDVMGKANIDFTSQAFLLELDTPNFIPLPELGSHVRTFDMAGESKAMVRLKGKGFRLTNSRGEGSIKGTHRFSNSPQYPVDVGLKFSWSASRLYLQEGIVATGGAGIQVDGTVDLKPFSLDLKLKAKEFPIQEFFKKFRDKNLHLIFGKGDFEASVEGIGKSIHFQLSGEAHDGGYSIARAEKAKVELDITYEKLLLKGDIFTEGNKTGEAIFQIRYGSGRVAGVRAKTITLDAKFMGQPLETVLPGYHLAGLADAELKLEGPSANVAGDGVITATNGIFLGAGFESIQTHFHLTTKQLVVTKAQYIFHDSPGEFVSPLTLDFVPGGFKMHGQPIRGVTIDTFYTGQNRQWMIRKLLVQDLVNPSLVADFQGTYSPLGMNIRAEGGMDLSHIKFLTNQIREGSGPVDFRLTLQGSPLNFQINGTLTFREASISLRNYIFGADELKGTLKFDGFRIETDDLEGLLGTGTFHLKGSMTHSFGEAQSFDFRFEGSDLYYRNESGQFRMEYDADVTFRGPANNPELKGRLILLDGRYTKDFNIIEELKTAPQASREIRKAAFEGPPFSLDLDVINLGDFIIDNNVGRIELAVSLKIRGTREFPRITGNIEVTEGEIRYLGLDLDITRGFMEFPDLNLNPYLEIDAEKELADVHITAKLHGRTNNLSIDLNGNSARGIPLEKKDILSLALFGMTTAERAELAAFQQFQLGPALVYEQIAHVLQRPIAKFTHLDIFRLEATPTREGRIQRFYLGKRVSDRFTIEFASEINQEDAVQTFLAEYLFTDFLLFKAARSTDENFLFNIGFRIKSR